MIAWEDMYNIAFITNWGAFVRIVVLLGLKKCSIDIPMSSEYGFQDYPWIFMKLFLDNFSVFSDLKTYLDNLWLCFLFLTIVNSSPPKNPKEHIGFQWHDPVLLLFHP
jgi:hypothetical protein